MGLINREMNELIKMMSLYAENIAMISIRLNVIEKFIIKSGITPEDFKKEVELELNNFQERQKKGVIDGTERFGKKG